MDETWPTDGWPQAAYTREKAYLERVLDAYEQATPAVRVVRIRPAFVFTRLAAQEQRRIFAGRLFPGRLVRPGLVPVVPDLPGLTAQVVHTRDAAEAFALAAFNDVHGPFNIATDPVADARLLAHLLKARVIPVPAAPLRAVLAMAWRLRLVPASPDLFDAVLRLPVMDTTRARTVLGWSPTFTAQETIDDFLAGLREPRTLPTPPLAAYRSADEDLR
ncbi:hypothetical protein GCM10029964_051780 [Kibdelosporangium lantanae]